jgi:hypothetical protein
MIDVFYRTPILKSVFKKNPSNSVAAGASSRMGKWTDTISSSAVVYYVIKDAYKAVRHHDNELLTHTTIFHMLSRQYYINLQHTVTATLQVLRAQTKSLQVSFILLHLVYLCPA